MCISVSLHRHLCVNEFVSVCVCVPKPNMAGTPSSEIKAFPSIPLRLRPNGTTAPKLTHNVREEDGMGGGYRNDGWMTSTPSLAFTPQGVENGPSSTPPKPLVVKERDVQKHPPFPPVCPLLYPLKLP